MAAVGAIRLEDRDTGQRAGTRGVIRRRLGEESVMADIERRAFVKGATLGALAFTVGGSTVMLTARQARAGNVPFRMLKENEAETIESMGETLVPGARSPASPISSISRFRCRRSRRCCRRASST